MTRRIGPVGIDELTRWRLSGPARVSPGGRVLRGRVPALALSRLVSEPFPRRGGQQSLLAPVNQQDTQQAS